MTPEQEAHLQLIKDSFVSAVDKKYRHGQQEHGGDLWLKKGLIDMAIEEALDQVVYLVSLKKQIDESGVKLGIKNDN